MTFEQSEKPGLKRKLAHEFKELVWIFLYLALFLCALATYKHAAPAQVPRQPLRVRCAD
jgi:hypothetical protein